MLRLVGLALASADPTIDAAAPPIIQQVRVSAENLFELAAQLESRGETEASVNIYRALASDPARLVRTEARFRLARLFVRRNDWTASAILLRRILDEQPDAVVARVELASMLEKLGDLPAARRELRAAQAGRVSPQLGRIIDRYAAALRDRRPFGGELKVALAPDNNINRATMNERLETILGDFSIDRSSQARSGVGAVIEASAFARQHITSDVNLLIQAGVRSTRYKSPQFNRLALNLRAGAVASLGGNRLSLTLVHQRHRVGGLHYLTASGLEADYIHRLSRVSQVRLSAGGNRIDNRVNALEDGYILGGSGAVDVALSPRRRISLSVSGNRRTAADPAYAARSVEFGVAAWQDIGRVTLGASASAGYLRADDRLNLMTERREDRSSSLSFSLASRHLMMVGVAPSLRFTFERNRSSVPIYSIRRRAVEIALTRAF